MSNSLIRSYLQPCTNAEWGMNGNQWLSLHQTVNAKKEIFSTDLLIALRLRHCSNYIFILDLTPGFIGLVKDNCKTWWGAIKFGDLVQLRFYGNYLWQYQSNSPHSQQLLVGILSTHWGQVTHIYIGNVTIVGFDNGLLPDQCLAITRTNAGTLLIGPLRTNFSEILIKIHIFS